MQITINHGGKYHGSYTVDQIQRTCELSAIDLVFSEGMGERKPLGE